MKALIYILSFIVIGVPVLLLIASQTGSKGTALPAVGSITATYFAANLIIKRYYPEDK